MMKQLIITFLLITFVGSLKGQNVTVIDRNEFFSVSEKQEKFYHIEEEFPLTNDRWLATMEGFCTNTKKSNLETLFYDFWKKANGLGANSFFIDEFMSNPDTLFVTISVFNLTEKELDDNYALYPSNKIYVFGDLIASNTKTSKPKSRGFKINKEKIEVFPLTYYEYQSNIGEKVSISIGGILGSSYTRTGEEGKPSIYFSLAGSTVSPYAGPMGGGGISFSNGSLTPLDMNFGRFLSVVLERPE